SCNSSQVTPACRITPLLSLHSTAPTPTLSRSSPLPPLVRSDRRLPTPPPRGPTGTPPTPRRRPSTSTRRDPRSAAPSPRRSNSSPLPRRGGILLPGASREPPPPRISTQRLPCCSPTPRTRRGTRRRPREPPTPGPHPRLGGPQWLSSANSPPRAA